MRFTCQDVLLKLHNRSGQCWTWLFILPIQELQFGPGESERILSITINNDDQPEVDEEFCVILSLPEGGAILGNITESELKWAGFGFALLPPRERGGGEGGGR